MPSGPVKKNLLKEKLPSNLSEHKKPKKIGKTKKK